MIYSVHASGKNGSHTSELIRRLTCDIWNTACRSNS